ncbi:hypothetical protein BU24DRAFT_471381 [Aaosphaeria arxii CBS 175.79]|uniref:ABC transporter domain-containing protein n=1 Tax=Aaosphaeria arxii CBS 175.79 TaxID=1450172 RepID=A0A6A5YC65_9PLEO|nr:uncharacterized protein BU24DRAFT_471381 [Aaosphaeria arxii CBS 175.79]KAF2022234.1 hypothetical protein BU24DRAFT_471381 [Aaosphaeria arxii CBS 175.79]
MGTPEHHHLPLEDWLHQRKQQHGTTFGVAFKNLHVYGFTTSNQYQSTISSCLLKIPRIILSIFSNRYQKETAILRACGGLVEPGEMLLVLGRPGSGCSTFLKTLAGDMSGIHLRNSSSVNYEGTSYDSMHSCLRGRCMYTTELDIHFPELTTAQTLAFAAKMRPNGSQPSHSPQSTSQIISSFFNLESAFDTRIGSPTIRGISGGEMKRASIAEAFLADSQLQCWDNSTRGLDSSTALSFVMLLRATTKCLKTAVLTSIYQASEQMYQAFDKVTLLYEGHQIYFGPVSSAANYFVVMGFERPSCATTADFLTSITNPSERTPRVGWENKVPRTATEFAQHWLQSAEYQSLSRSIDVFNARNPPDGPQSRHLDSRSISQLVQIQSRIARGLLRLRNNFTPVVAGVVANTIIAIVTGSVFYNLPSTTASFQQRSILLFFAVLVNGCTPTFEVLTMWAQRPIVEKHQRYAMYHPLIDCCASIICDLPNKLVTTVMFNIPLYFMTNLRRSVSAWFTYILFIFIVILTMSMFFRMVGSLSKTIEQTMAPVATLMLMFTLYNGFVLPVDYMHPWLAWFRWINPFAYAYEGLMINEFSGTFPCASTIPAGPGYDHQVGMEEKVCNAVGAIPGEKLLDGKAFIAAKYGFLPSHLWRNLGILLAFFTIFGAIHLLAAEYIPASRSKGEVLLFKGKQGRKEKCPPNDIETTSPSDALRQQIDTLHYQNDRIEYSREVQKQTSTLYWKNVNYDVTSGKNKRRILNEVNGWVKPGTLAALMGPTGAGKTTLLDVLANRTSIGVVTGDICIGQHAQDATSKRRTGYVQQQDIHHPQSTVREALEFSALLRQPNERSTDEKLGYVNTVLKMLEMESYADAIVGIPGEGLNIEQRKRLTIAVELAARPPLLLFLDEPTSGLDSQTAWSICMLLKKLARNGQAILCTIHQPSAQIFQLFDRLLLLDEKGHTAYFGDIGTNSSTLTHYFERNGATPCSAESNAAEWVVDNLTSHRRQDTLDRPEQSSWVDVWNRSTEKSIILRIIERFELQKAAEAYNLPRLEDKSDAPLRQQMLVVLHRTFAEYWRDPTYLYSKLALSTAVAIFSSLSFYMTPLNLQGLISITFSVFLLTQLFSTIDQQIIPRLVTNRDLFEARENRSETFSWVVFVAANIIVELVWQTLTAVLVFVTWYYPLGLWRNGNALMPASERGGLAFAMIWMFFLFISTLSQAVGIAIQHAETAVQVATLLFYLSLVFCGVIVNPADLPRFWLFMYRISPLTYFIAGVVTAGLAYTQIKCSSIELLKIELPTGRMCGEYMDSYMQLACGFVEDTQTTESCNYCPVGDSDAFLRSMGIRVEHKWRNFWILACYVVFNVVLAFGLYWMARAPRRKRT